VDRRVPMAFQARPSPAGQSGNAAGIAQRPSSSKIRSKQDQARFQALSCLTVGAAEHRLSSRV